MTAWSLDRLREQPVALAVAGLLAALVLAGALVALGLAPAGPLGGDAGDDRLEPNDDFESAATVEYGRYEELTRSSGDDYYAVSLAAEETLTATIRFEHADGDLELEAYGPEGAILARSDSVSDDETVTVTAATSGRHYLRVYGHDDAANEYVLAIETEQW